MSYDTPKVGGDVDAWCSKCEMDLAHTVVAMVEGKVVQARCNTCGAFHKYRRPKKAASKSGTAKRRTGAGAARKGPGAARRPSTWEKTWNAQVEQAGDAAILPYRMTETFEKGALVQHKSFGLGVVQQVMGPTKVEILFREGLRTLVMGRG